VPSQTVTFYQNDPPPPGEWVWQYAAPSFPAPMVWQPIAAPTVSQSSKCWEATVSVPGNGYVRAQAVVGELESSWSNMLVVPEPSLAILLAVGGLGLALIARAGPNGARVSGHVPSIRNAADRHRVV